MNLPDAFRRRHAAALAAGAVDPLLLAFDMTSPAARDVLAGINPQEYGRDCAHAAAIADGGVQDGAKPYAVVVMERPDALRLLDGRLPDLLDGRLPDLLDGLPSGGFHVVLFSGKDATVLTVPVDAEEPHA